MELAFNLEESFVLTKVSLESISHIKFKQGSEGRLFVFAFNKFSEQVRKVYRLPDTFRHLFHLVLVENMAQIVLLCYLIITCELDCWKSEFRLLHVVVYSLIEVLTHVSFENHRKMVAEPLALVSTLYWLSC